MGPLLPEILVSLGTRTVIDLCHSTAPSRDDAHKILEFSGGAFVQTERRIGREQFSHCQ